MSATASPAPSPAADPAPTEAAAPLSAEEQAAQDAAACAQAEHDAAAVEAAEREAQLQRLLQRMQKSADFPSLKDSIRSIQKVSRSETAHLRALTDEVLGDVALTNKLLRLINTAFYSSVGGGGITSIKRAVALMGFQSIGMLAASLTLFDKLPKGPDGERVRAEFRRALLAAMLASELCPTHKLQENAYLAALFQNLGPMLAWMHFRDEATQIEAQLAEAGTPVDGSDHAALQKTSRDVLGMGYEDLGVEVAGQWGWPEDLQLALRRLEPRDPEQPVGHDERLRVACTAANHLARQMLEIEDPQALEACLARFTEAYGVPLGLDVEHLTPIVERSRQQWADLAVMLGMSVPGIAKAGANNKVGGAAPASKTPARPGAAAPVKPAAGGPAQSPQPVRPPAPMRPRAPVPAAVGAALSVALEAISQRAMSDAPLGEVLQFVMAQLQQSLQLQRVVVCLRDSASGELRGRLGSGDRAMQLAPMFRVPMRPPGDLFGLLCTKGADTLISDASDALIARSLPGWFHQQVKAPTFLLLPLTLGQQPLGLIYGDRAHANSLQVGDAELTLLKAMRNQLVMAMRLRGAAA
ncbi:putative signal transduction protein [Leptothrix cholodnii SP-6]|uniref:Putative signal transduction protein n=1 Tax=Leptothrix cholodnii (strain ATCC 51168 / LMG 8142 / SP-6) TaxID=395495 RepID=B1Y3C0_LEPCP|nr:HDOD domain-containing protein [Leptothrix cholodnii]ACB33323.1 putative signal transduction protein [Leptothrix cholodnii SP-6]